MSTITRGWVQQAVHGPKRKRAGLVCIGCHEKKIKCDLQSHKDAGFKRCSRCTASNQECQLRPSKRGLQTNVAISRIVGRSPSQTSSPIEDIQVDTQGHEIHDSESALCTPPGSTAANDRLQIHGVLSESATINRSIDASSCFTQSNNYLYPNLTAGYIGSSRIPQVDSSAPLLVEQRCSGLSPQSSHEKKSRAYLGQSGFLSIYSQEHQDYTAGHETESKGDALSLDVSGYDMLQIFTETYFNYCYAFCPVLDMATATSDLARSPLLATSVALVGSQVQPPIIPFTNPAALYSRAKRMFYEEEEPDPVTCVQAICLFYWWSPRPSNQIQKDGAWWWSAAGIRLAQQIGWHRELGSSLSNGADIDRGLQRRIWWTLFARERLTAICQSRPCLINLDDCDVPLPTLEDFPDPNDPRAEVFIYWVKLCNIIGRVAKYRSQVIDVASLAFPTHLAEDLIEWIMTLPDHLKLPIESKFTATFDRDVHQLHLPYLAVVIILHLSPSPQPLPRAYVAAVMAASCVARIFKDYLSRGSIRFLMPVSGWICGIATMALLRASRLSQLTHFAEEDIKILVIALKELRVSYPVADMFLQGFERLQSCERAFAAAGILDNDEDFYTNTNDPSGDKSSGADWLRYFPYMTTQTSGLAEALLAEHKDAPFIDEVWLDSIPLYLQEPFGLFGTFSDYISIT